MAKLVSASDPLTAYWATTLLGRLGQDAAAAVSVLAASVESPADLAVRQRIADGWLDAREVATGSSDTIPSLPPGATPQDAAAWTLVARVLLNLDETVSKH